MIKNSEVLSMSEAIEYVKKTKDKEKDVTEFMKKFIKLNVEDAKELRKKIEGLGLMKVKTEHVAKIIDLIPENAGELNKIFIDISLDEDETKKILETIKEFK